MCADDTVIYASGTTISDVQETLQSCFDYVYQWCISNRLYMNMKKTKIMWFETSESIKAVDYNYSISIDGVLLSKVHNYLY